ncbi:MAG: hypothetical protein ACLU8W_10700 [Clostridia bacterium]
MAQVQTERRERRRRKHPWAFPLGLVMVLLAVVGLGTVIFLCVQGVRDLSKSSQRAEYEEYQAFLTPVVMFDPDAFDDLTQANPSQLIDCAIWALLTGDLEPDQYQSDAGTLIVPQSDVEKKFAELFGSDVKPAHQTVDGYGYQFAYDSAAGTYTIPLTGVEPIYTPQVVDAGKQGNTIVVTVAYIASNQWAQDENGNMVPTMADKYMRATLRDNGSGGYYLSALQPTDEPEAAITPGMEVTTSPETVSTEPDTQPPPATEAEETAAAATGAPGGSGE